MSPSDGVEATFRRGFGTLREVRAVWIWLAGLTAVQLMVEISGGPNQVPGLYRALGLTRDGVLSGKVWQLLSYGLLHGNMWHLGINCGLLLGIGASVERMLNARALSAAFAMGVVSGGLFHALLGTGLLVGASGGCVALLMLLTTLSPQSRMFPLPVSAKSLGMGILIAEGLMTGIQFLLGLPRFSTWSRELGETGLATWFRIGHACHFGGGVCGWCLGHWILRPRVTLAKLQRDRARREARGR